MMVRCIMNNYEFAQMHSNEWCMVYLYSRATVQQINNYISQDKSSLMYPHPTADSARISSIFISIELWIILNFWIISESGRVNCGRLEAAPVPGTRFPWTQCTQCRNSYKKCQIFVGKWQTNPTKKLYAIGELKAWLGPKKLQKRKRKPESHRVINRK